MPRTLTPIDGCVFMNALYNQATGKTDVTNVDASNFASVGEQVLATGTENVYNSVSIVMGKTLAAVRPYNAKLGIIQAISTGEFTHRLRKISFYSKDAINAGFVNTDLYTNLKDGYDNGSNSGNSVPSMWKQDIPPVLEMNFAGSIVWQEELTLFEKQISMAFRSPEELATFLNGVMLNKMNTIEKRKEGFRRGTLLDHIAMTYLLSTYTSGTTCIDLIAKFNSTYGTSYSRNTILQSHLDDLLKVFVTEFKLASDYLTEYSSLYHYNPPKTVDGVDYVLNRQTHKADQRSILYGPLFTRAKASVLPEIFNPQYLDVKANEFVNYWQSIKSPTEIKIKPSVPIDGNNITSENVVLDYFVGILFDRDAILVDTQWEDSAVTPLEARKKFRNMIWDFSYNPISDPTENCVIFYLGAGEVEDDSNA